MNVSKILRRLLFSLVMLVKYRFLIGEQKCLEQWSWTSNDCHFFQKLLTLTNQPVFSLANLSLTFQLIAMGNKVAAFTEDQLEEYQVKISSWEIVGHWHKFRFFRETGCMWWKFRCLFYYEYLDVTGEN